jgi:hypothetical protein
MKKDVLSSNEFTSSSIDSILVDAGSLTYTLTGFTVSHAKNQIPSFSSLPFSIPSYCRSLERLGYGMANRRVVFRPPAEAGDFYHFQHVQTPDSTGVKRPEHETDYSPLSDVEIKNGWSYPRSPPYILMTSTGTALPF